MAKVTFIVFFTIFILWMGNCATAGVVPSSFGGQESLKVPPSKFLDSLKLISDSLQHVTSILLQLQINTVQDNEKSRLPSKISTCLELMKLSAEELRWCVSALKTPDGKYEGTGNLIADLRTWLGNILINADTCMDGFEGSSNIKDHISVGIEKLNILVSDVVNQVHKHNTMSDHFTTPGSFPSWVKQSDKKLLLNSRVPPHIDVVVAADGTGNFTRVMDAVLAAPISSPKRFVIHIKRGVYTENVFIDDNKQYLMVIGDGKDVTIISGNLSYSKRLSTYGTATFGVTGKGFIAQKISFKNTAGPKGYQSVALVSSSDLSVFYQCGFYGYQDTLYAHIGRQFYKDCLITGTVDFIFGYATVVFQSCDILVKKGLPSQKNTITANGGKHDRSVYGFIFQFCNISAAPDLLPFLHSTQTFLGRPWKAYATTIFMESYISDVVSPAGWLEWKGSLFLNTLYYAEYKNYGPGAEVQNRVKWTNYHVLNNSSEATKFSVAQFISGEQWLPSTGVPFIPGLGDKNITGGR